jgi:cysteinyl-tRNA synthetase
MSTALDAPHTPSAGDAHMSIRVYNTLTKTKEAFEPMVPGQVGIYLCGPTVYKEAHIGHMVGPVIFDTIKRFLRYNGFDVTWVVNITDVDDKLIAQSQQRGIGSPQIATEMTMDYCANLLELGVDQITHMPRATEHIEDIIAFISNLIDKGFAYASGGDVFFDVAKDAEYGKLSNRSTDDQQGEGGEAAAKKRSPGDFALWKAAKSGEPAWESPWGPGRPGWHIECSAMSRCILGESFDIHGGGLDLMFPHHENEIAQSECCHGRAMAKYWLHNGLLRAGDAGKIGGRSQDAQATGDSGGKKMSRSEGAGGLRGMISRQGGERIRFFLLRTHYRSTIVFSEAGIEEAGSALDKFYLFFDRYSRITGRSYYLGGDEEDRMPITSRSDGRLDAGDDPLLSEVAQRRDSFLNKMDDDFNSGAAVSELFNMLGALNKYADERQLEETKPRQSADLKSFCRAVEALRELATILGMFLKPVNRQSADDQLTDKLMQLLIEVRADARENKNFAIGDKIRDDLAAANITLEDRKQGTTWRNG